MMLYHKWQLRNKIGYSKRLHLLLMELCLSENPLGEEDGPTDSWTWRMYKNEAA